MRSPVAKIVWLFITFNLKLVMKFMQPTAIAAISTLIYMGFAIEPSHAVNIVQTGSPTTGNLIAQQPANIEKILLGLPRPKGSPTKLGTMFNANAYQQKGLNFQTGGLPQPTVDFYRQALSKLGYQERTINATIGDWGFSIVFDSKKAVLTIQGTKLGPNTININVRFEEI